jgi:hypothetical protein
VDHVSTFQALTDPNQYLLAFGAVDPTTGTFSPVAFEQVNFVTPSAVPEPATGLLCLFGVGTLVAARRRRRRGLVEPR